MNAATITETPLPAHSQIALRTAGADFADCYTFADPQPGSSAMETYLAVMGYSPGWMSFLMSVRNQAVRLVGLKHLGGLEVKMQAQDAKPAASYSVGDRAGIFSVDYLSAPEVILFDDDKHLRVELSVFKHQQDGQPLVSVSTVVHNHNALGRAYMAIVGPVHRLIVPKMLSQSLHAARTAHQ
ncbi:MAG: hypothetical protein A3E00_14315 [Curvibacter sp. RIFCSPHIGHO2_12_FULL_63_18]|uniref:DUF2867 domain-containing protein n=1 Tax=Rhodoferax sp. TaxID=50421 RepID=UPI0008C0D7D1|nr:DUF2867 domain-containing protein [Rhodoferax sp.]OGO94922.1 MAG: hypothetical protein A2037_11825 [Curvibacter sp. GWA2_63_95]OGP01364.1 MAG: hypothetical protein A3E00_14315 [Curvibacter sp. RIFCSPHIGHO2_12_FULL_63_18]HCX82242.1 DUF2867 domain-containing protein [Rhodoferax sp.]